VLLLAFGSLVGALLPIVVAVFGLGVGTSLIIVASHGLTIPSLAPILAALIGLGVGIDYALFIVTRFRSGVRPGLSHEDAVVRALDTSGRAVIFAGTTVCIALLGMLVTGRELPVRLGHRRRDRRGSPCARRDHAAARAARLPGIAMRVISRSGRRKLRGSGPVTGEPTGVWARWEGRREAAEAARAGRRRHHGRAADPDALALRLGSSDQGNDPSSSTTRKAYDLLAEGFGPGFNGPLDIVAQLGSPSDAALIPKLAAEIKQQPPVVGRRVRPGRPGKGEDRHDPGGRPDHLARVGADHRPRQQPALDRDPAARTGHHGARVRRRPTAIFVDFAHVIKSPSCRCSSRW
jgi:RND superfamily putative drug exporter